MIKCDFLCGNFIISKVLGGICKMIKVNFFVYGLLENKCICYLMIVVFIDWFNCKFLVIYMLLYFILIIEYIVRWEILIDFYFVLYILIGCLVVEVDMGVVILYVDFGG